LQSQDGFYVIGFEAAGKVNRLSTTVYPTSILVCLGSPPFPSVKPHPNEAKKFEFLWVYDSYMYMNL